MAPRVPWLFLFWLALASSSLVHEIAGNEGYASLEPDAEENKKEAIAQDEIAELANAVRVNLPKKLPEAPLNAGSRTWAVEAKMLVEAVEKLHRELTERNLALRVKQLAPKPEPKDLAPYGHVKGMLIKEDNKPFKNIPNAQSCELKCSLDTGCKAFSFNEDGKECLISSVALGYDPDSTFYAKAFGKGNYNMYPGMTETSILLAPIKGKPLAACEMDCSGNMKCQGFSYKQSSSTCTMTSEPLHYDAKWDYYEKPPRSHKLGEPFEVATHQKVDQLSRDFTKFWNEHEYHVKVNDKKKINSFKSKIAAIKGQAQQAEDEIRAKKSAWAGLSSRASQLSRAVKSADTAVSQESDGVEEAQGRVDREKLGLKLAEENVLTRQRKLKEDNAQAKPAYLEDIFRQDTDLEDRQDKLTSARQASQTVEMDLHQRTKQLRDAKIAAAETNRQYIEIMTAAHSAGEDVKVGKNRLEQLATEAKELTKIVDREAQIVVPPPETVQAPSLEHLLSWDLKSDRAAANSKALEIEWMKSQGQGPPSVVDIPPKEPEVKPTE